MHDSDYWLKVLGLGRDATEQQIGDAYRDLVKVWHPDRFESDPRLRQKGRSCASNAWIFAGVTVATAAAIGAVLYVRSPRDAVTAADAVKPLPEVPPQTPSRPTAQPEPRRQNVPDPTALTTPTTGMLAVFSQPSGAMVFVDDHGVGQTPLTISALAPGEHRIRIQLDGYPAWSSPVAIEAGGGEKLLAILERKRPAH